MGSQPLKSAMVEILEIPEVRARVSKLSLEEYHQLGEFNENGRRTELIRGIVIEKMSKSPLHSSISTRLQKAFAALLGANWDVRKDEPLTLVDSEPEPDIAIVPALDYSAAHPSTAPLVVEVAVTSVLLDRANCELYAEAGVEEYWIVIGGKRAVEVYRKPSSGKYSEKQIYQIGETITSIGIPGMALPVASIFAAP